MTTLREWYSKNYTRPLKIIVVVLIAIWSFFAGRSYLSIVDRQQTHVDQTSDLISLAINQKNRVMTESLIETLVSQGGASAAEVCSGLVQQIGANAEHNSCSEKPSIIENLVEKRIPGYSDLKLRAKFNILTSLFPMVSSLGYGLIFIFLGFYVIQKSHACTKEDLLDPLLGNLLDEAPIKIKELSELRQTIQEAKDLAAQRAVTLAIQENNQQVAHDIRGPLQAMNALFKMANISDANLRLAIEKSLLRANAVANDLLRKEKHTVAEMRETHFDMSQLVRDIVSEKRVLFAFDRFNVELPTHLVVRGSLSGETVSRILSNLVDNAILACKDKGSIRICVKCDNGLVAISIRDTGCGIPAHFLRRVGEKGFTQRESGTGRGVYSAKKTLASVGGAFELTSQLGEGTEITVRFPGTLVEKEDRLDFVLIDNEEIHRLTWRIWAKRRGYCMRAFESVRDFLLLAPVISRSTAIFMDFNLGENETADKYLPDLSNMGFANIYFVTSHEGLKTENFLNLKGISGKDPELAEPFLFCKSPNNLDRTDAEFV